MSHAINTARNTAETPTATGIDVKVGVSKVRDNGLPKTPATVAGLENSLKDVLYQIEVAFMTKERTNLNERRSYWKARVQ
jgi:hypothetical protein